MSEARFDRVSNENNTAGPIISGITTFSGQNFFVPPKGTTAQRPSNCPVGSIRFNTDSAKLEYFDGLQWLELEAFNVELGVNGALGNRGLFGGGLTPTRVNTINFITISSTGNATDFGDLTQARQGLAACSSSTRGVFAGGQTPVGISNVIEYVTISSTGNAQDFGDLSAAKRYLSACSSSTRGVFGGGDSVPVLVNVLEYITIASTGDAKDFGDLTGGKGYMGAFSSSTRGIFAGGYTNSPAATRNNVIEFITISTTGNASDFGDLSATKDSPGSCSNSTRGIIAGGYVVPGGVNTIEFITISTLGNASDFGDLTVVRAYLGACSSSTRGVFGGGYAPGNVNTIDYVTILTTGNAVDFGDLLSTTFELAACSNGHGGL